MKILILNESKHENIFKNLKLWYQKYYNYIDGANKSRQFFYLNSKSKYDDYFENIAFFQNFIEFANFVINECVYISGKLQRMYNSLSTPNDVRGIARGLEINFGSDIVYYTSTNDLDDLRVDFEFVISLHKYIVRNCMNENRFFYAYEMHDSGRFKPCEYFNPEKSLEDVFGIEFDYKKQKPIANDNWIRVRDELGFLKDIKGKNFI